MSTFDSRIANNVHLSTDTNRTPGVAANHVGWVAALVWPAVWTAVVAGSLLGSEGTLLFWAGVVGVLAMFARQAVKVARRNVRRANFIIDNAPFERVAQPYERHSA
ncbi:hypothetical protein EDF46_1853 [Frondihabitans sp. PhB188]|uniref:hypothetical protein n=1 Tax=Frondihabitans sp. PhB188 TaxID=2485200 RepID=UPI000F48569D|nr:hypothetical protein [Frondihabitans sp. PhB188]ROQ38227.1 hypothetical protein EDF46_1853 [Frondihabitans sp. PhB188]